MFHPKSQTMCVLKELEQNNSGWNMLKLTLDLFDESVFCKAKKRTDMKSWNRFRHTKSVASGNRFRHRFLDMFFHRGFSQQPARCHYQRRVAAIGHPFLWRKIPTDFGEFYQPEVPSGDLLHSYWKLPFIAGWWYTYPSEKYEFVNGKDYPIYYGK